MSPPERPTARAAIDTAFAPRSVAIFGASEDPKKLGHVAVKFLKESGYDGRIIPVNPKGGEILGLPVAGGLAEIRDPIDLAISFVPAEHMLSVLHACEDKGVKVVVGVTSGFAESGEAGAQYEHALRDFLARTRMRIIGPNCEGIVVPRSKLLLSFSPMFLGLRDGNVALVSQSGAICGMMANRLAKNGVGIRAVVTTGNETDITAADVLEWLADDESTDVVLMYLEQIRDAERFVAAARRMQGRKRIVINKVGRSSVGQRAAQSHTGALAGDDRVVTGVFAELGIVRANDTMAAVDAAAALSLRKRLKGRRIGVISFAGGMGAEAAELAEIAGYEVPPFGPALRAEIGKHLPFYGSSRNPIDLTGSILQRPGDMRRILELVLADKSVDGAVAVLTFARNMEFAHLLVETAAKFEKPLITCWTGGADITPEALSYFREKGFPIFDAPVRAVAALDAVGRASGAL